MVLQLRPLMAEVGKASVRDLIAETGSHDPDLGHQLRLAAIRHKYAAVGGLSSRLGLPIDGALNAVAMPLLDPAGGRAQFRGGDITIRGDGAATVATATRHVKIWLAGIECGIRQESVDEIYGCVGTVIPATHVAHTHHFPEHGDPFDLGTDGSRIVSIQALVYEGPPSDVLLHCVLIEHDSGSLDDIRDAVNKSVQQAATIAGAAVGIPSEAISSDHGFLNTVTVGLTDVIANALGASDDLYTPQVLRIAAKDLIGAHPNLALQKLTRGDDPRQLEYTHKMTVTGTDDGGDQGSYTFYYRVTLQDIVDVF